MVSTFALLSYKEKKRENKALPSAQLSQSSIPSHFKTREESDGNHGSKSDGSESDV